MTANDLRKKFINFFEQRGHKAIASASLIPENDPTVLFTTAGMHPLIPYLMGESHPQGKRLTDVQKCIRTDDIDEVGDQTHHTFFEMIGNWSLGDYFKKEAIEWSYEFLTSSDWLGVDKSKLAVTVFAGDEDAPFDKEAYDIWTDLGIAPQRIAKLGKEDNWWGPAGEIGPCGPDTEIFFWTGGDEAPEHFDSSDKRWVEIWNVVFMQYSKISDGKFQPLKQINVDTGMGLERTLAVLNGFDDNYRTELFWPIIEKIAKLSQRNYQDNKRSFRIIADHIKAAVFAIGDGALPSNKGAGYIVRRLIRRAIVQAKQLGIEQNFILDLSKSIFDIYEDSYIGKIEDIEREIEREESKFRSTLERGLAEFQVISRLSVKDQESDWRPEKLDGKQLFDLYQSFGFPLELSLELASQHKIPVEENAKSLFEVCLRNHQELSRTASAGMFKGGLADAGEMAIKYHTTTHLLHAALRNVLGKHVQQKGSNINVERLRFDFSHPEKMTPEQITEVENIINEQIDKDLPVFLDEMTVEEAKRAGALGFFESKYGEKVKVYTVGDSRENYFSKEICGGPHVDRIGQLGKFKIKKEEASSAGVRRIKAVLE